MMTNPTGDQQEKCPKCGVEHNPNTETRELCWHVAENVLKASKHYADETSNQELNPTGDAAKPLREERLHRCDKCGAVLKRDQFGPYCPTRNCQWSTCGSGIPKEKLVGSDRKFL